MIVCSIEYILLLNIFFASFYALIFEMGSVFMLISMAKDLKRGLKSINKKATAKQEILHQFTEIIQFQYDAKQLSERHSFRKSVSTSYDFSLTKMVSPIIFTCKLPFLRLTTAFSQPLKPMFIAIFYYGIISVCSALLLIQKQLVE